MPKPGWAVQKGSWHAMALPSSDQGWTGSVSQSEEKRIVDVLIIHFLSFSLHLKNKIQKKNYITESKVTQMHGFRVR